MQALLPNCILSKLNINNSITSEHTATTTEGLTFHTQVLPERFLFGEEKFHRAGQQESRMLTVSRMFLIFAASEIKVNKIQIVNHFQYRFRLIKQESKT